MDQTVKHVLDLGYRAKIFDIDRYVGWGTPADYEGYQKTWNYFKAFWEIKTFSERHKRVCYKSWGRLILRRTIASC